LLTEYVLFTSFILIALLHNAVRKFGTFFASPGIYSRICWWMIVGYIQSRVSFAGGGG